MFGLLFSQTENTDAMINILADGTGDSKVVFYSDVAAKFSVGNDATDHNLTIATGANLEDGQLLKMDTAMTIHDDEDTGDKFSITVAQHGATTLATVDDDAAQGVLTLDADGIINIDANNNAGIAFKKNGAEFARLNGDSSTSRFTIFENVGASEDDYFRINVAASGATSILTVDAAGTDANIAIGADGNIELNSKTGEFLAKHNNTEFSVANSAYAGMILGYRMIGEDAGHSQYTFTTSYAVPDSNMNVKFVAPPSGNVEITVQVIIDGDNQNINYFALSDNATYNSIGATYEHITNFTDETDYNTHVHSWAITGLTAGTAYQYWLGVKSSTAHGRILWGGSGAGRYGDFIMKAVALPAATTDFAVYD